MMSMAEAINNALYQAMEKDSSVLILGQDVAVNGGVFRVTDGLLKKFGSERVYDTPLAESGMIGCSIGLGMTGFKPVVEMQFSDFMSNGFHMLIYHASKIRNRTRGKFHVPIVIRAPVQGGIRALEHHSESMEGIYSAIPGLKTVMPSSPYDAKGLLLAAIDDPDPVIFFEPKKLYRIAKQEVPDEPYKIEIGKANVVKEGKELTIITWGSMVRESLAAAQQAEASIEVIDLRSLNPWDIETVSSSVKKTGRVVIVQEAPRNCSVGSEIAATLSEKLVLSLDAPIKRVTGYDVPYPYFSKENIYLPNANRILNAINEVLSF